MNANSNYRSIEDVEATASMYQEKEVPAHLQDRSHRWCLISFVATEGTNQIYKHGMAMRVNGCKSSKPAANKWARTLPAETGGFDVCTLKTNEWVALPPRLEGGEDRCNEERVDDIMLRFKDQEVASKQRLAKQLDREQRTAHALKPLPAGVSAEDLPAFDAVLEQPETAAAARLEQDEDEEQQDVHVPDHLRDREQAWCVLSVVAPEYPPNHNAELAVRIYGCRASPDEAENWAQQLRDSNPYFTVYSVKCNDFAAMPPDPRRISKMHSNEKVVQNLHDQYTTEQLERRKDQARQLNQAHA